MSPSLSRPENDLLAEKTQQDFNKAAAPLGQAEGVEAPRDPKLELNKKDVLSKDAALDAGLDPDAWAKFVEKETGSELGSGDDQGLNLER